MTVYIIRFIHIYMSNKKLSKYEPSVLSRVYSENGELMGDFALQKRLFIPYDSIPEKVINSFLSAEDKNFFEHPGVDARGVTRAIMSIQNSALYGGKQVKN